MPLEPADHEVLALRDNLRDLLALLDLGHVQVNVEHIGTRSTLAIAPLPLDLASRLIRVLDTHPDTRNEPLPPGTVLWDPRHRLVGEVVDGTPMRVTLCSLVDNSTWLARPSDLAPPHLADITTSLDKAQP